MMPIQQELVNYLMDIISEELNIIKPGIFVQELVTLSRTF